MTNVTTAVQCRISVLNHLENLLISLNPRISFQISRKPKITAKANFENVGNILKVLKIQRCITKSKLNTYRFSR